MDRQSPVVQIASAVAAFAQQYVAGADRWCVALSGGADSLALTAAAARVRPTTALIVDHGLQAGSGDVAENARLQAMQLGCIDAQVLSVTVGAEGGLEAAARTARYAALDQARNGAPVLIGHTLDDQAETVLLGLGRGSGPRSIAGTRPYDPPWCRPLLALRRQTTEAACAALQLTPWHDPHNTDGRFTRARLRHEVLPLLEDVLGGGVAAALARTATALQEDGEVLDALAHDAWQRARDGDGLAVAELVDLPAALRRRVIRLWLLAGGAVGLTAKQLLAVDALLTAWRGQGGVAVPSTERSRRLFAARRNAELVLYREPV
jgi:tRNA(Ile)-lysidine synthase